MGHEFSLAAVTSSHPTVLLVGGPTSGDESRSFPSSDVGTAVWRLLSRDLLQHKPGHSFQNLGTNLGPVGMFVITPVLRLSS